MLELRNITRRVDLDTHLADVSIRLERGSFNVLLGPPGSGKTSLMRVMAGLDRPTSGQVFFDDVDVTGRSARRRNVAMVYPSFVNYPGISVRDNIASPLKVKRTPKATIEAEVARAAELLGLTPDLDRKPLELSGGQQQRVAIARAIVKQAGLVLLDEPLANLDLKLREDLRQKLPKLFEGSRAVVVYATAEPTEALLLGGRTATMSEGKITQIGRTPEVYRKPHDLVTARTFSDPPLNLLPVHASNRKTWPRIGDPAACGLRPLPDGQWTLGFRAHHLRAGAGSDRALTFSLNVLASEITGSESLIRVAFGPERWVMLIGGVHRAELGSTMRAFVEPEHVLTFDADGLTVSLREAA